MLLSLLERVEIPYLLAKTKIKAVKQKKYPIT